MIIGRGKTKDGNEFLLLGLSDENIRRLKAQPIHASRKTHGDGIPEGWEIIIFAGKDELSMAATLKAAGSVSKDTKVYEDPRL